MLCQCKRQHYLKFGQVYVSVKTCIGFILSTCVWGWEHISSAIGSYMWLWIIRICVDKALTTFFSNWCRDRQALSHWLNITHSSECIILSVFLWGLLHKFVYCTMRVYSSLMLDSCVIVKAFSNLMLDSCVNVRGVLDSCVIVRAFSNFMLDGCVNVRMCWIVVWMWEHSVSWCWIFVWLWEHSVTWWLVVWMRELSVTCIHREVYWLYLNLERIENCLKKNAYFQKY